MMTAGALAVWLVLWKLNVQFPVGGGEPEQIVLRWLHFVAGIIWVGLLYFFNLVNAPAMKALDAATRGKVVPVLMPKALWRFRRGAVVTSLAGHVVRGLAGGLRLHFLTVPAPRRPAQLPFSTRCVHLIRLLVFTLAGP